MTTLEQDQDINIFGIEVADFPSGISSTFEKLVSMLPGGFDRSFYGITQMRNGSLVYIAAAEEKSAGEAEKYNCERVLISKGKYLAVSLHDWRNKTDSINKIFHEIMNDARVDPSQPCIEWYRNNDEMICMVMTKE